MREPTLSAFQHPSALPARGGMAGGGALRGGRRVRVGMAGLALVGYLSVLAASPVGQGLRLLGHLARSHSEVTLASPLVTLGAEPRGGLELAETVHQHGGVAHAHDAAPESDAEVHEHDGVAHSHRAPDPGPAVTVTTSLDKHRLPQATQVPAPRAPREAALRTQDVTWTSADGRVETPPPIGRS